MAKIPDRNDFLAFVRLFQGESDRARVVLGGAYLDACLEETLRTWLDGDVEEVFQAGSGLLTNYGAKLKLAVALGAISKDICRRFKIIGDIRNHFSHRILDATWEHPDVQKRIAALRTFYPNAASQSDGFLFVYAVGVLAQHLRTCERRAIHHARDEATEALRMASPTIGPAMEARIRKAAKKPKG